jgi:hypothetical protein
MIAASRSDCSIFNFLVTHKNIDVSLTNSKNKTALDYVQDKMIINKYKIKTRQIIDNFVNNLELTNNEILYNTCYKIESLTLQLQEGDVEKIIENNIANNTANNLNYTTKLEPDIFIKIAKESFQNLIKELIQDKFKNTVFQNKLFIENKSTLFNKPLFENKLLVENKSTLFNKP